MYVAEAVRRLDVSAARTTAETLLAMYGPSDPPLDVAGIARKVGCTISPFPEGFLEGTPDGLRVILGQLHAAYDPVHRTILVADGIPPSPLATGIAHELGHDQIPAQAELLRKLRVPYHRLSPLLLAQFEAEARTFAFHLRLFGPRFSAEMRDLPFGLHAALALATRYDVSIDVAFKAYVDHSPIRGVLWYLTQEVDVHTGEVGWRFKRYERTPHLPKWRGITTVNTLWPANHAFCVTLSTGRCSSPVTITLPWHDEPCQHDVLEIEGRAFILTSSLRPTG